MTLADNSKFFFVFDVESIGLHGGSFAVAWVVIDKHGAIQEEEVFSVEPEYVCGCGDSSNDRAWVKENVPPIKVTHSDERDMRNAFWDKWIEWKEKGALLVADCPWPVEARFLSRCIDDNHKERCWDGPYPFLDLASILFALGMDPIGTFPRKPNEEPAHHPLADAKQSARILVEVLQNFHGPLWS